MDIKGLMRSLWQSACIDKPSRPSCTVRNGAFVFNVKGNRENWASLCEAAGVPTQATQDHDEDVLNVSWNSEADRIFGDGGMLAQVLPDYQMRLGQLHMARLVQRAIEMKETAAIEAGTGTGKSFAYLAPAMAMNKQVIVSTSNKALQMQLVQKDAPFLAQLFPGKKVALVQGKSNYACMKRADGVELEGELHQWYLHTESGNLEEIPFAVDYTELDKVRVDEYCTGKHCAFFEQCYYYKAKAEREAADILVCNHALLVLHLMYPGANILPGKVDLIVVDEAHQFATYIRNMLGEKVQPSRLDKFIDIAKKWNVDEDLFPHINALEKAIARAIGVSTEPEVTLADTEELPVIALANELLRIGEDIYPEGTLPDSVSKPMSVDADKCRDMAAKLLSLHKTMPGHVRWIHRETLAMHSAPYDVSWFGQKFIESHEQNTDSTRCTRCYRELTSESIAVLNGQPYGPECIKKVDILGDAETMTLVEWLAMEHPEVEPIRHAPAVVFCSATLAAPDMTAFKRELGIQHAMEMIAQSPFDYENNGMIYIPGAEFPTPGKADHTKAVINEVRALVMHSKGGAFLLFTSYKNMQTVYDALAGEFQRNGLFVLKQGEMPKLELAKRFRENGDAVLFATKSFWEGVDIKDNALRLVIIDKMPFNAPSPLTNAMKAHLKGQALAMGKTQREADWYPFEILDVPAMTNDLKQGIGRLIRTDTDRGVVAILDPRLRTAQYARRMVLPSLPPMRQVSRRAMAEEFIEQQARRMVQELEPIQQFALVPDFEAVLQELEI